MSPTQETTSGVQVSELQSVQVPVLEECLSSSTLLNGFKDYFALTKPRIMVLLLISTCCPMVLAAKGAIDLASIALVLIGGALVSGSASAINCIWDRDIDAVMERTKTRPIPAGRIDAPGAMIFALALAVAGLALFYFLYGLLTAAIALAGHLFYVFIYTIWLKRSSPQNIVIGGAAGAFPPMVGWSAVTGSIDLTAIFLFAVIFLWTPPHFWALALNKNEDYRRASIPMMPVVKGFERTVLEMFAYSLALLAVSLGLVYVNQELGYFSAIVFFILGAVFTQKIWVLMKTEDLEDRAKAAWDVFGFSLVYLAAFFICLVVDATVV